MVIPALGCYNDGLMKSILECSYSIKVKTADETDAGTDKSIRLQLSQGDTKTHWIELRKNKNDFERNK